MLANMDDRSICRNMKADYVTNHIPVILISGTHDLAQLLHQKGAPNDFIPKPIDIDVLLRKVEAQLQ